MGGVEVDAVGRVRGGGRVRVGEGGRLFQLHSGRCEGVRALLTAMGRQQQHWVTIAHA